MEWISVKDRLPTNDDADENGNVLACYIEVEYWIGGKPGKIVSKDLLPYKNLEDMRKETTYWMPVLGIPNDLKKHL